MKNKNVIIALDQGTTSSRAIVFDHDANIVTTAQREFTQIYPQPAGLSMIQWRYGQRSAHHSPKLGTSGYFE